MSTELYTMTREDMTEEANVAVSLYLRALEEEGLLAKPADEILQEYAVIIHKKGYFGKMIDAVLGLSDGKTTYYRVVKVVK